jgi:hypothetical protein
VQRACRRCDSVYELAFAALAMRSHPSSESLRSLLTVPIVIGGCMALEPIPTWSRCLAKGASNLARFVPAQRPDDAHRLASRLASGSQHLFK